MPLSAEAISKTTFREREMKYQDELLAGIKSRTGKESVLPSLTASPKVEAPKEVKKEEAKPLKFEDAPKAPPTPTLPSGATVDIPTSAPKAAAPASAPKASPAPSSNGEAGTTSCLIY